MLVSLISLLVTLGLLAFCGWFIAHYLWLSYSAVMGAPYVPSKTAELEPVLARAQLNPADTFLDVGCGDGRVVLTAVATYGVSGTGIDINPVLIRSARRQAHEQGIPASFYTGNIKDFNYRPYSVIYLYLLPQLIQQITARILKQTATGTLVISHWFSVRGWEPYLESTYQGTDFTTYYYRMPGTDTQGNTNHIKKQLKTD
jgi:SAM-dependent methyltransferase